MTIAPRFRPLPFDMLEKFRVELEGFICSELRIDAYMRASSPISNPKNVVNWIYSWYHDGAFRISQPTASELRDDGPYEQRFIRVKEASSAVLGAFRLVYGAGSERAHKHRLQHVFMSPEINNELGELRFRLIGAIRNPTELSALKHYAELSPNELEKRVGNFVTTIERSAFASMDDIRRADVFMRRLYQNILREQRKLKTTG